MRNRFWLLLTALLLLCGCALAEDVCTIDLDKAPGTVSTTLDYIRVTCTPAETGRVSVTVTAPDGGVCYSRDYGEQSGSFRSESICLRGGSTAVTYQVRVDAGTQTFSVQVEKRLPRMKGAAGCAAGYPLSAIGAGSGWEALTLLEVPASGTSSVTVPLCAGGSHAVGTAVFTVSPDSVLVRTAPAAGASIDSCTVLVASTAAQAMRITQNDSGCAAGRTDSAISFGGADCIAVYLRLQVSYDPNTAEAISSLTLSGQRELWSRMQ